jgi:hypothetical protein
MMNVIQRAKMTSPRGKLFQLAPVQAQLVPELVRHTTNSKQSWVTQSHNKYWLQLDSFQIQAKSI